MMSITTPSVDWFQSGKPIVALAAVAVFASVVAVVYTMSPQSQDYWEVTVLNEDGSVREVFVGKDLKTPGWGAGPIEVVNAQTGETYRLAGSCKYRRLEKNPRVPP